MAIDLTLSLRRRKAEELANNAEEPTGKKLRAENLMVFPLENILSETDINDVEFEMGRLSNTESVVKCGVCNKDVRVVVQNGRASNIVYHSIFLDSSNSHHQILELMCDVEGPGRTHVAGLLLNGQWWSVEAILTSNDLTRDGAIKITTFGERIILSVLNRIVFGYQEHLTNDPVFSSHPYDETANIMWQAGKAVGFYSIKRKGKLMNYCLPDTWQMNVLDTIFVRKNFRRQGLACKMLEHFLDTYPKQDVGLSYPVEKSMLNVCKKVLSQRPADRLRVWELMEPGYPPQRKNIWFQLNKT